MSLRALPPLSSLARGARSSLGSSARPLCARNAHYRRGYATITPSILEPRPPPEPPLNPHALLGEHGAPGSSQSPNINPSDPPFLPPDTLSDLDARILQIVRDERTGISLPSLLAQFDDRAGDVLPTALKYEPSPAADRRVWFSERGAPGVVAIAHATGEGTVRVCSGFALEQTRPDEGGQLFVTCAHTLEEMRRAAAESQSGSGTFVVAKRGDDDMVVYRATAIPSALPRSDVMLLRATPLKDAPSRVAARSFQAGTQSTVTLHGTSASGEQICSGTPLPHQSGPLFRRDASSPNASPPWVNTTSPLHATSTTSSLLPILPVSPYPVHPGTRIRAHFVRHTPPVLGEEGWVPWVGGMWSKWVSGQVVGYRDFAGKEAKPGTYDSLSHLLFEPIPSPGSSGGPIVDEETGAVVGIVLGARMDSTRIDGMRGWGVPAETVLEMFSLPGLEGKQ
ncbi:hypothetical protein GGF50DRAFT_112027 [Schizophyllum commune]